MYKNKVIHSFFGVINVLSKVFFAMVLFFEKFNNQIAAKALNL